MKGALGLADVFKKCLEDLPGEAWKDIPFLMGYAMISNYGRVKRLAYETTTVSGARKIYKERIQMIFAHRQFNKFVKDHKIILQSKISVEKVNYTLSIGRLIYYCFLEDFDLTDKDILITYKDGNGLNVSLDNLLKVNQTGLQRIVVTSQRIAPYFGHSIDNQILLSQKAREARMKQVHQCDTNGKYIATFNSLSDAAKITGVQISSICSVLKNRRNSKTAGGFVWKPNNL